MNDEGGESGRGKGRMGEQDRMDVVTSNVEVSGVFVRFGMVMCGLISLCLRAANKRSC